VNANNKPVSKLRIALMWLFLVANIVFWICLFFWIRSRHTTSEESSPGLVDSVFRFVIGGFFVVAGAVSYAVVLLTNCFTFNFNRPVWHTLKPKLYLANILVPLMPAVGLGFAFSGMLGPFLVGIGVQPRLAGFLPFMAVIAILLTVQVWVLFWAPLERQVITRRLLAQGITPAQIQIGILLGLSNPASGFTRRFAAVEEDLGMLWVGPEQLLYWGDTERFGVTREELLQIEQRADNRSATVLGGVRHIILHLALPGGGERQLRLHVEGLWTLGQKRRVMDRLAEQIHTWHSHSTPAAA
jgi:hypothetical protein